MEIKGYKKVTYDDLQVIMQKKNAEMEMHEINMAAGIDVKSVGTIRNAFTPVNQSVSDEVLTKLTTLLEIPTMIVWINGERNYYLSAKH